MLKNTNASLYYRKSSHCVPRYINENRGRILFPYPEGNYFFFDGCPGAINRKLIFKIEFKQFNYFKRPWGVNNDFFRKVPWKIVDFYFRIQFSLNYFIFLHLFRPVFDDEDAKGPSGVETKSNLSIGSLRLVPLHPHRLIQA